MSYNKIWILREFREYQDRVSFVYIHPWIVQAITEVNRVDGPYDIIVKLSNNNMDTIKESIGKYMTRINGIQSTLTLVAE